MAAGAERRVWAVQGVAKLAEGLNGGAVAAPERGVLAAPALAPVRLGARDAVAKRGHVHHGPDLLGFLDTYIYVQSDTSHPGVYPCMQMRAGSNIGKCRDCLFVEQLNHMANPSQFKRDRSIPDFVAETVAERRSVAERWQC